MRLLVWNLDIVVIVPALKKGEEEGKKEENQEEKKEKKKKMKKKRTKICRMADNIVKTSLLRCGPMNGKGSEISDTMFHLFPPFLLYFFFFPFFLLMVFRIDH